LANSHKNARLTFEGRKLLIERIAVMGVMPAAAAAGISARCARKWVGRFKQEGDAGLVDRSCRPHRTCSSIDEALAQRIEATSSCPATAYAGLDLGDELGYLSDIHF
jgi:hypothetical protein